MTLETRSERPVHAAAASMDACSECGHDDIGERGWVARLFKLRASCPRHMTSAESGVGLPGPCGCTNGYHA